MEEAERCSCCSTAQESPQTDKYLLSSCDVAAAGGNYSKTCSSFRLHAKLLDAPIHYLRGGENKYRPPRASVDAALGRVLACWCVRSLLFLKKLAGRRYRRVRPPGIKSGPLGSPTTITMYKRRGDGGNREATIGFWLIGPGGGGEGKPTRADLSWFVCISGAVRRKGCVE